MIASKMKLECCCVCGDKTLKFHDPDLEDYPIGETIGVVYGEHLTGSYSWDDIVKPIECSKGHVFYVPEKISDGKKEKSWTV